MSTASVLPRTPADVNDAISVVFIGSQQFNPAHLYHLFCVRKSKICRFLAFLKRHNHLYSDIDIDVSCLELFPDDGPLPGVHDHVIHHHVEDSHPILKEETAGFALHPTEEFEQQLPIDSENVPDLIEKLGVTDPECDGMSGHQFVAAAFRNLIPSFDRKVERELPDLVLHHDEDPIHEYHNYALVPGMYPTFFPFGIGGFKDPS